MYDVFFFTYKRNIIYIFTALSYRRRNETYAYNRHIVMNAVGATRWVAHWKHHGRNTSQRTGYLLAISRD